MPPDPSLALLITPAAYARLLTDRLGVMMILAPVIGVVSCVAGLYLSYAYNLAAGGLIVLVVTGLFLACWVFAPRHGLLAQRRTRSPGDLQQVDLVAGKPLAGQAMGGSEHGPLGDGQRAPHRRG
jgi:hypothetical protein